jgi:hypothetical protein
MLDHDRPQPYKIDQLTAMKWARAAWKDMKSTVIQNCWRHTGLLSGTEQPTVASMHSEIDDGLKAEFDQLIAIANIKNAMDIANFLNLIEEQEILEELETADQEQYYIETAGTVEVDEEQEAAEAEVIPMYSDLSKVEEIQAIAKTIALIEQRENSGSLQSGANTIVSTLRAVQQKIRWEIEKEKEGKRTQLSLDQYFHIE